MSRNELLLHLIHDDMWDDKFTDLSDTELDSITRKLKKGIEKVARVKRYNSDKKKMEEPLTCHNCGKTGIMTKMGTANGFIEMYTYYFCDTKCQNKMGYYG